jgi:CRISPR/Cas system-associated protein Cas7 (RAMP superfamily)
VCAIHQSVLCVLQVSMLSGEMLQYVYQVAGAHTDARLSCGHLCALQPS